MPISLEEYFLQQEAALSLPASDRVQDPTLGFQGTNLVPGVSFDSIDVTDCCNGGTSVPPDPELGVGPNHIIAVVNTSLEVYDKVGTSLVGPVDGDIFFANLAGCTGLFDPNVNYDEEEDRWFMGWDDGNAYCMAVTQTGDAAGVWNLYRVPTLISGATLFDYPHAGIGDEAIFMGSNQFAGGFIEGRVWAFDKQAMYNGSANPGCRTQPTGDDSTPWPADLHGSSFPTGPHYIMTEVYDGANHSVWEWTDPFGVNSLVKTGTVDLVAATGVAAGQALNWPQLGSANLLQGNDFRGQSTHYRNGHIWMSNQTISCNPGTGSVNCARWAEIDPNGGGPSIPSVVQAGVIASNGEYRTFASLAVDACDNMAIGYSKGSTTMFPATWVTGREAGDPLGTVQDEQVMKAGEVSYRGFDGSPHRWGDYTGMTIDPDGKTFWYLGEYAEDGLAGSTNWANYIGSFAFDCAGNVHIFSDGFESGDTLMWN